uniref:hypothetical protein n=1 Tax=Rhizobium rhizoryzae TaxID=451876 RepID=UPI0035E44CEC
MVYLSAAIAGLICSTLHMPLPWMIGPLLMTAGLSLRGLIDRPLPVRTRPFGQAVVSTTVGLPSPAMRLPSCSTFCLFWSAWRQ